MVFFPPLSSSLHLLVQNQNNTQRVHQSTVLQLPHHTEHPTFEKPSSFQHWSIFFLPHIYHIASLSLYQLPLHQTGIIPKWSLTSTNAEYVFLNSLTTGTYILLSHASDPSLFTLQTQSQFVPLSPYALIQQNCERRQQNFSLTKIKDA